MTLYLFGIFVLLSRDGLVATELVRVFMILRSAFRRLVLCSLGGRLRGQWREHD